MPSPSATQTENEPAHPTVTSPELDPLVHDSAPEGPEVSEAANLIHQSNSPPPYGEQVDQIKELEEELSTLKSQLVVALDKLKRAFDREEYQLELVSKASEDLSCIRVKPAAEIARGETRVKALMNISASAGVEFWADRHQCLTIVELQDRAAAVGKFMEYCRSALAMIYSTMFPRNPPLEEFESLMKKFSHAEDIRQFVRIQLFTGARFALAWVHVHHPKMNLEVISQSLPPRKNPNGVSMDRHYAAIRTPAIRIFRQLLEADSDFFTKSHYADDDEP